MVRRRATPAEALAEQSAAVRGWVDGLTGNDLDRPSVLPGASVRTVAATT